MRLTEVSVQNYRSITAQTRFSIEDLTALVGPNNEGKSNLLRAVALGMELIQRWSTAPDNIAKAGEVEGPAAMSLLRSRRPTRFGPTSGYRWSEDFPLDKQATKGARPTTVRLRFRLTDAEIKEFATSTGITSNGELPIELSLGRLSASFGVVKPGPGAATHRAKAKQIAQFISSRLTFVSVPAIRTGDQALALVNDLARMRMQHLLASDEYQALTDELNSLRQKAVARVGRDLTESVRRYLPSITSIDIQTTDVQRANTVEELIINDGTSTSIESKGDGIKSLVTMALIQEFAQERSEGQNFILAVDEPEAHLHSLSVHELQNLFEELSQTQQVILATHNPIFVNRERVDSNVLVVSNAARPAKSVAQIREALGVQLHDNLASADTVVLVEGISDERVVPKLLSQVEPRVEQAIANGRMLFRASRGAGKMRAQIQREKSTVCRILVVLDDDAEGRSEARRIRETSLLPDRNVFMLGGRPTQAELEDLVATDVYLPALSSHFGRVFTDKHFSNRSRKWSANLQAAALALGIPKTGEELRDEAKSVVSEAVSAFIGPVIKTSSEDHVRALATMLFPSNSST